MACYNCLGPGHPSKLCPSLYGAGVQKSTPKCNACGGFGHDTPACTLRPKYTPPPAFGKGKGKGKDKGKGTGGSQLGKGAWRKGKGNVSAFDDAQWQWAQASAQDAQWPPGLTAPPWPGAQASAPVELWMQAAAAPPPWLGAGAPQGGSGAWPAWPGTGSVRSFAGGFSSIGPVRKAKLHEKPMPVAPLTAPVPTMNRYDALSEYISPEVSAMAASREYCAFLFARIVAPEEFPIELFLKPTKLIKKGAGKRRFRALLVQRKLNFQKRSGKLRKRRRLHLLGQVRLIS